MQSETKPKGKLKDKSLEDLELELAEIMFELAQHPKERVPVTNNCTIEKLALLEHYNGNGITFNQDEVLGILQIIDSDNKGLRQEMIGGFEGGNGLRIHRVSRACLPVRSHTISIGGTCQPGPIKAYVKSNIGDSSKCDGLIQRLTALFAWLEVINNKYVDNVEDPIAKDRILKIAELINRWVVEILKDENQYRVATFTSEAQVEFIQVYERLMTQVQAYEDTADIQAHLGKYAKLIPAVALIFEVIEQAEKNAPEFNGKITLENLKRAEEISIVLFEHAKWLYDLRGEGSSRATYALYDKIISGDVCDGQRIRDIYHNEWTHLKKPEEVRKAIEELMELGWCCAEEVKSKTKPSIVIRLHPSIRK